jgi:hypothetical protein
VPQETGLVFVEELKQFFRMHFIQEKSGSSGSREAEHLGDEDGEHE